MRARSAIVAAVFTIVALGGCLGGGEENPTPTPSANASPRGGPLDMYVVASDSGTNVAAGLYTLRPSTYQAHKGDQVLVTLKGAVGNAGRHALLIDEFGIKLENVGPNEFKNATFSATKAGSFKYYCNVGNHRQLGMEGTLTIS